ncbi:hypothetical protein [Ruegeria atlantica]|uniref:hypothetical protein n=1 Tax=Ruegeria atlantica TaxID=81569 RepID=UPI002494778C|nr:hypothetical protein [Ruegeria atlantica]
MDPTTLIQAFWSFEYFSPWLLWGLSLSGVLGMAFCLRELKYPVWMAFLGFMPMVALPAYCLIAMLMLHRKRIERL